MKSIILRIIFIQLALFSIFTFADQKTDADLKTNSYIKIGAKGEKLDAAATQWSCVLDKKTHLMWENKQSSGLHDIKDLYIWNDAFEGNASFVSKVNQIKLCGYSNWRGPTKEELASLFTCKIPNCSGSGLFINQDYFPSLDNYYWSTTPNPSNNNQAMVVHFKYGEGIIYKSNSNNVRLVRNSQ